MSEKTDNDWKLERPAWDAMVRDVALIRKVLVGGELDGNNERSVMHLQSRFAATLYGPEGQPQRGIEMRTEALELSRRDEAQQRRGAMYVIGVLGTIVGGTITAAVTWLLEHGKKP